MSMSQSILSFGKFDTYQWALENGDKFEFKEVEKMEIAILFGFLIVCVWKDRIRLICILTWLAKSWQDAEKSAVGRQGNCGTENP